MTVPLAVAEGQDVFRLDMFEPSSQWTRFYQDERFVQRYRLDDGRIYCETVARVVAEPDPIRDQLWGPWDWWANGCYENRVELSDGRIAYDLWPVGKLRQVHVHETMSPPDALPDGGWRVRLDFARHARGVAYFEIRPQRSGGCDLVGRFAGVEIAGVVPRLMGVRRFCINHLLAERGGLTFPFPRGTGWAGLIRRLER